MGIIDILVTQSRMASLVASFKVRLPEVTGRTWAPKSFIRKTFKAWGHIDFSPYDHTFQAKLGGDGSGGDPMLSGSLSRQ